MRGHAPAPAPEPGVELMPFATTVATSEAKLKHLIDGAEAKLASCADCPERPRLEASLQRYRAAQAELQRIVNSTVPRELATARAHTEELRTNVGDLRALEAVALARRNLLEQQQQDLEAAENATVEDLTAVRGVLGGAEQEFHAAELVEAKAQETAQAWASQVQSTVVAAELSDDWAEKMYGEALQKLHAAEAKEHRAKELFSKAGELADRVDASLKPVPIAESVNQSTGSWGSGNSSSSDLSSELGGFGAPAAPAAPDGNATDNSTNRTGETAAIVRPAPEPAAPGPEPSEPAASRAEAGAGASAAHEAELEAKELGRERSVEAKLPPDLDQAVQAEPIFHEPSMDDLDKELASIRRA